MIKIRKEVDKSNTTGLVAILRSFKLVLSF